MQYIIKSKWLFYILQWTWGFLMSFVGILTTLILLITKHKPKKFGNNWYFIIPGYWGGISLGCMFITDSLDDEEVKCHESGHIIQNIVLGPLFIFLIAIPSFIRCQYFNHLYKKGLKPKHEYDDIWFEGQATKLGVKYYGNSQ